ncbi:hypothetical protein OHC33_001967 [Knufia fluminis]|uniref:Uncharacterized protein n=1 Tax=Knufia fluminis TaxID=191047 RepID=A0AAN8IQY0_9EURO|nr:hypothetical protein OHC33_001967 [Knufia fluminis]
MAHARMHTRNDSGVSVHSLITQDSPPSPTLTNPEMIIPIEPWQREPSFDRDDAPHPLLEPEVPLSQTLSNTTNSTYRNSGTSDGSINVATAILMPMSTRPPARPPTTIHGATTPIPTYTGYEHGAPLSDIYEESEANATPRSTRQRTPSPIDEEDEERGDTTPTRPTLRHKKRHSAMSTSSSGGSDVGDWENFDSSKVLSSRVAADLAQMRREDTLEVEDDVRKSRRQSREEEELAALNARAEKILENARKRLTHMEDNLKVARNSIIMPSRSPNLGGEHQPVGGLYRSISAAGASKLGRNRQGPLAIRTSASLQHMRGVSDAGVSSATKRSSRLPDIRSASALEYGSQGRYTLFPPDTNQSPTSKVQQSPASSRGFNSPLRPLEEERGSPSTAETTPESVKAPMKGLGILSPAAAMSKDNLAATLDRPLARETPTPTRLGRSTSSASTRSTKELKEQMTDLKTRIAELRSKAQEENLRRRSFQSLRSSSPYANASPEQSYASSPAWKDNGTPINATAGVGWRSPASPMSPTSPTSPIAPNPAPQVQDHDEQRDSLPITPANVKFLDVDRMTPDTEARLLSSARTDRNTPSLARQRDVVDEADEDDVDERQAVDSVYQQSQYEDASDEIENQAEDSDEETERIAENEEEQIYLNEMLEESLRDAEVEPEVPAIPGSYLETPNGTPALIGPEAQRHEDRLDAFDYENMFLHSAMGTYTGRSLNGSDSGSDADSDDDGSVETSRAGNRTPVDEVEGQVVQSSTEEAEGPMAGAKSPEASLHNTPRSTHSLNDQQQLRSPPRIEPAQPPKPWAHARSNSMDSVTTSATYETATEGEGHEDEGPNEMLSWGPAPSSSIGYSPTSYQAYRVNQNHEPPMRARYGFSSPQGGGRSTPLAARSPMPNSPLRQQHFEISYDREKAMQSPGLGLGLVGAENGQYINDNGVPERFQGRPSPTHSRQSSAASAQSQNFRPESQATIVAASPIKSHRRQYSSIDRARSPLTASKGNTGSPVTVTVASSPQRKVVINKALQRPGSYTLEPQMAGPPNAPLPAPPSSAILQAQIASPKKVDVKRSNSAQKRTPPTPQGQYAVRQQRQQGQLNTPPVLRDTATSPMGPGQIPNTEILMESLIKLADPSFTLAPGIKFEEVDKHLVLGLLGAVGGVCNSILTASVQSGSPSLGKTQAEQLVYMLRTRLEEATTTLEGRDRAATPQGRGRTMKEI